MNLFTGLILLKSCEEFLQLHLTIHVQREPDNSLLHYSIDLGGTSITLNIKYSAGTASNSGCKYYLP